MMGEGKRTNEDEANELKAREKLLARRNSARAKAFSATQTKTKTDGKSEKSLLVVVENPADGSTKTDKIKSITTTTTKQQDNKGVPGQDATSASSAAAAVRNKPTAGRKEQRSERRRRSRDRNRDRNRDGRMSSNRGSGGEASAPSGPAPGGGPRDRERGPRGNGGRYPHPPPHHRDEFGRGPPPPGYYNDHHRGGPRPPPMRRGHGHRGRGGGLPPPHYREGGPPPGRWERDRGSLNNNTALPPHPRASRRGGRPRSPPPHRRHHGPLPPHLHRDDHRHPRNLNRTTNRRESSNSNIRHRSRRGRSPGSESSRSYSSRSRSRSGSFSSHGSSSSFSSSGDDSRRSADGSSYDSDASRSRSPSRSRSRSSSRSRSPQPQSSPVEKNKSPTKNEKDDAIIDKQKEKPKIEDAINKDKDKDKDDLANAKENEAKKEDGDGAQSPSSSKKSTLSPKSSTKKRSRSHSHSPSVDSRGRLRRRGRERKRKSTRKNSRSSRSMSRSRSPASSVSRSHSPASSYSTSSSHYSREHRRERKTSKRHRKRQQRGSSSKGDNKNNSLDELSKDQRTIFVSQLVMRTTERDIKKYFKKKVGCKVNDVILLRDRRNARNHKGCAYVEVGRIEDVATAVAVSGQPPDFQRFPILIKASEAEKNYVNPLAAASAAATNNTSNNVSGANLMTKTEGLAGAMSSATAVTPTTNATSPDQDRQASTTTAIGTTSFLPPLRDESGRLIEAQKVYVGGLDPNVREEHLYALFSQFGTLQKVQLQYHPNTQISRGYAFLAFRDPKVSHLAIRTMSGKFVAGRPLKTGWANQNQQSAASIASGCTIVTSDQFPEDAADLTRKALSVLAQMTGGTTAAAVQQLADASMGASVSASMSGSNAVAIATMAEQELDKAIGLVGSSTVTTNFTSVQAVPTVAEARASMAAVGGAAGSRPGVLGGATVAEARASLAADVAARQLAAATSAAAVAAAAGSRAAASAKSLFIGNTENGPTPHLLVHNMYNKDEETEPGWEVEIKQEFLDECSKFGTIEHAKVMHALPGGQIYATFADSEGAQTCAENLAGRWFDKRQLRVDYMPEANPP